jgi:hypothetical protein
MVIQKYLDPSKKKMMEILVRYDASHKIKTLAVE